MLCKILRIRRLKALDPFDEGYEKTGYNIEGQDVLAGNPQKNE